MKFRIALRPRKQQSDERGLSVCQYNIILIRRAHAVLFVTSSVADVELEHFPHASSLHGHKREPFHINDWMHSYRMPGCQSSHINDW